ncbi:MULTISPECIES: 16S rRNA (uracil(1498)-N(3))-methyltransferase [unclassified Oceanobacillus]|uniref:16S rRNA (uracil(1498)-N(3))-methyltransferase n=1 Tax=unclassified Oceanobacillus TaxID=2630292 RepID=UPI001BEA1E73|nr:MULTISPECIES: 16S rRNA (uracil(1498)-N(3))-methyltransferase [unclassified Oceanobacillus]MBT2598281.1 16S rRNA (uracil(1498)-N(3))-methyltransferase [Oceanobacillus sp. ISL-74]MBT2651200.1 16S rRNA (uracil(1498)-N(3))-methyltransferase [Oceanobacillus sp. ISL-73]
MQRYFVLQENVTRNSIRITGDDVHHLQRVMRSQVGENIICNSENGQAALCRITMLTDDYVDVEVIEWLEDTNELPVHVTIAQGIPKGDKFDLILQKGTELGATAFIPFQAERSIAIWNDEKKYHKKVKRFQKILKEASEQSHRNRIPTLYPVMNLKQLLDEAPAHTVKLFAYEEEAKTEKMTSKLVNSLQNISSHDKIILCIGPEGGFSNEEADQLIENDFIPIRLGKRILRTETAALYALSSISYQLEELRCLT